MINRRQFGCVSAGSIALAAAPAIVRGQNLNSRLQVAGIGCDGKGWSDIYLNHYHGWVDGCIDGVQPSDGFGYAAKLTEAVLLGNVAVRFRKQKLQWDEAAMKFTGHDDANTWLRRDYRNGWDIEAVV